MQRNRVSKEGAEAIAELLQENKFIQILKLNATSVGTDGFEILLSEINGSSPLIKPSTACLQSSASTAVRNPIFPVFTPISGIPSSAYCEAL